MKNRLTARKQSSTYQWQQHLTALAFLLPAVALLIVFLVVPAIMALGYSFTDFYITKPNSINFIGLDNFKTLVQDDLLWKCLGNTVYFVVVLVPVETVISLGLAMIIKRKRPGRTFFRLSYFAPVMTSATVVSILWVFLYNPSDGLINSFLNLLGIESQMFLRSASQAMNSIIGMTVWQGVGYQMLIFLAGLNDIPEELYEAASMDGAGPFQRFIHVTLPGLKNVVSFIVVYLTIMAFKIFTQPYIMTNGGPENSTRTIVYYIYQQGFQYKKAGYSAAIAVVFFLLVVVVSGVLQRVLVSKKED